MESLELRQFHVSKSYIVQQFIEEEVMVLVGEAVFCDELGGKVQMGEVFLVLEDQQVGIHAWLDDLAVLSCQQVRGGKEDHVVLVGGQLRNHLQNVVWQ